MGYSHQYFNGGLNRRDFIGTAGIIGAGLVLAPTAIAQQQEKAPAEGMFYQFVNNTKGKFSDDQISWSFGSKDFKTLAEAKGAPARMGGGGRINFQLKGGPDGQYRDFIEFTHGATGWYGNTTLVDEFVVPFTIELFNSDGTSRKVGITESCTRCSRRTRRKCPRNISLALRGPRPSSRPAAQSSARASPTSTTSTSTSTSGEKYATEKVENGWSKKVVDGVDVHRP